MAMDSSAEELSRHALALKMLGVYRIGPLARSSPGSELNLPAAKNGRDAARAAAWERAGREWARREQADSAGRAGLRAAPLHRLALWLDWRLARWDR